MTLGIVLLVLGTISSAAGFESAFRRGNPLTPAARFCLFLGGSLIFLATGVVVLTQAGIL